MYFTSCNVRHARYCKKTRMLMTIYAIQSICGGIAYYISLFLKSSAGMDPMQISTLVSVNAIGNILGSFVAGYVADKYNPSYALKTGLILQGCGLLCLVFATSFYVIFFTMGVMGFGSYLYITSSLYILNSKFNNSSQNRTTIIARQYVISNIGMFFSAILMGYCAAGYYSYIFISLALLVLTIAIAMPHIEKDFYMNNSPASTSENLTDKNSSLYLLGLFAMGLVGMIFSQYRVGYPVFLESRFGNIHTGYLMALNPLFILFFQNIIIKRMAKYNELIVLAIGLLLFSSSFLLLNQPGRIPLIVTANVLFTLGEILAITHAQSIAFGYAPMKLRGRILGLYKSIYSITKIIGAYLAGAVISYNGYLGLWYDCAIIGATGALFTLFVWCNSYTSSKKFRILGGL